MTKKLVTICLFLCIFVTACGKEQTTESSRSVPTESPVINNTIDTPVDEYTTSESNTNSKWIKAKELITAEEIEKITGLTVKSFASNDWSPDTSGISFEIDGETDLLLPPIIFVHYDHDQFTFDQFENRLKLYEKGPEETSIWTDGELYIHLGDGILTIGLTTIPNSMASNEDIYRFAQEIANIALERINASK